VLAALDQHANVLRPQQQRGADFVEQLAAAAKRGNVSAMKALAAAFDRGEHQEQIAGETAAVRRERAETAVLERPSKKAIERRAALSAGEGTDWGDDLHWQRH
jgi:hypothetical protein